MAKHADRKKISLTDKRHEALDETLMRCERLAISTVLATCREPSKILRSCPTKADHQSLKVGSTLIPRMASQRYFDVSTEDWLSMRDLLRPETFDMRRQAKSGIHLSQDCMAILRRSSSLQPVDQQATLISA